MTRPEASSNWYEQLPRADEVGRRVVLPAQKSGDDTLTGFRLLQPLGSHTWKCTFNGGTPAAARWIGAVADYDASEAPDRLARLAALRSADLLPLFGLARGEDAFWLVSELDRGICLRRLLQIVGLSAVQAVVIAADVLAALTVLHDEGLGHGRVRADNVHVGVDGKVRLGEWAVGALSDGTRGAWRETDYRGFAVLVSQLIRSARRDRAAAAARQELLSALDEVRDLHAFDGDLRTASAVLDGVLDGTDHERVRAEFTALVANLNRANGNGSTTPVTTTGAQVQPTIPIAQPAQAPPTTPVTKFAVVPHSNVVPWWLRAAIVVGTIALLGGLVAIEFSVLRERIGANIETLLQVPMPAESAEPGPAESVMPSPATTPGTTPRAVPPMAPEAAGEVMSIDLRPLGRCAPGGVCSLRTLIQVWPQQEELQIRWDIVVVDRCTGVRSKIPGRIAEVPPGGDRVDGVVQVALPESSALAVVAVTTMPAQAASAPLLVPADGGGC